MHCGPLVTQEQAECWRVLQYGKYRTEAVHRVYIPTQQHTVQQVQAGWWEAVVRPIEASLMEQEENWSTWANTHTTHYPLAIVYLSHRNSKCVCVCVLCCVLHLCFCGWVVTITSCARNENCMLVFHFKVVDCIYKHNNVSNWKMALNWSPHHEWGWH